MGDGEQRRDFTNVEDVVEANVLAAKSEGQFVSGGLFNIGTGKNYSILEIAEIIGGDYEFIPPRLGESRETLANINKAKSILKWEPTIQLEQWLRDQ